MPFNQISYADEANSSQVFLENNHVGEIKKVEGGWQYYPNRSHEGGEVLPTRDAVKATLEAY